MDAAEILPAAIHLAVLGVITADGVDEVRGVLAYDGHGRRHLAPVTAAVPTTRLRPWLPAAVHRQLVLPLDDIPPGATSSGTTWRTWVLPTIPIGLRLLPPEQLASAFAEELLEVAT